MDALLQQLIDLVKQTAPQLWEMALMQVEALNRADTMLCWILGGVLLLLLVIGIIIQYNDDGMSAPMYWFVFGICAIIIVVIIASNVYMITLRNANPNYYAIQVLMALVK